MPFKLCRHLIDVLNLLVTMIEDLAAVAPDHSRFAQHSKRLITLLFERRLIQIRIIRRVKLKVGTVILEPRSEIAFVFLVVMLR